MKFYATDEEITVPRKLFEVLITTTEIAAHNESLMTSLGARYSLTPLRMSLTILTATEAAHTLLNGEELEISNSRNNVVPFVPRTPRTLHE